MHVLKLVQALASTEHLYTIHHDSSMISQMHREMKQHGIIRASQTIR